jgi:hypothetical protein
VRRAVLIAAVLALVGAGTAQAAGPVLTVEQAKHRIRNYDDSAVSIRHCSRWEPQRIVCLVISWQPITAQTIDPETGVVESETTTARGAPVPLWGDVTEQRIGWSFELPER